MNTILCLTGWLKSNSQVVVVVASRLEAPKVTKAKKRKMTRWRLANNKFDYCSINYLSNYI